MSLREGRVTSVRTEARDRACRRSAGLFQGASPQYLLAGKSLALRLSLISCSPGTPSVTSMALTDVCSVGTRAADLEEQITAAHGTQGSSSQGFESPPPSKESRRPESLKTSQKTTLTKDLSGGTRSGDLEVQTTGPRRSEASPSMLFASPHRNHGSRPPETSQKCSASRKVTNCSDWADK
jgi:hypothetical protein